MPTSTTGNVRVIYKPTGEALERTLPRTKMVLSQTLRARDLPTLQPQDPCGDFLDALISIVLEHPAYLSMEDCPRYASLIHTFSEFNATLAGKTTVVAKTSLEKLHVALVQWVNRSIESSDVHPLMSSYVLDTAQLIEFHAYGEHKYSADLRWEVDAMVDFGQRYVKPFFDRDLKRNLTQSIQGLLVNVVVPPGARFVPTNPHLELTLEGPCEVYAMLIRCHLSESVRDFPHFKLDGVPRPTLDLMDNFRFSTELVPIEAVEALLVDVPSPADPRNTPLRLELPGNWITANLDPESRQWKPVPTWIGPDGPTCP